MEQSNERTEQVDVRKMWKHEALCFTPWLAKNLKYFGEEIGLDLELIQTEKQVGPLSLDILAREVNTGEKVAIENQLEWSDTHHLGQLITYATGCDAQIAVWVATDFRYHSAAALHKLNQWTRSELRFYAIKVEAYRKDGDQCLQPKFTKVVYPGGWDEELILPAELTTTPKAQKYNDFYQPLVSALQESGFLDRDKQYFGTAAGRIIPRISTRELDMRPISATRAITCGPWLISSRMTEIYRTNCSERLHLRRELVEASIELDPAAEWDWNQWEKSKFFTIAIIRSGSIDASWQELVHIRKWMYTHLHRLKDFFEPRLEEILKGELLEV